MDFSADGTLGWCPASVSPPPAPDIPTPGQKQATPTVGDERLSARGGSVRKGCFATDYFPQYSGTFRALSPWTRHPRLRPPLTNEGPESTTPSLPHLKHCIPHSEAQCARCALQRRGVRDCCSRGHHRCRTHQKPPCALCASRQIAARTCCTQGHHVSPPAATTGKTSIVSLARPTRHHAVPKTPSSAIQNVPQGTRMLHQLLNKRAAVWPVASGNAPSNKKARLHVKPPRTTQCLQLHEGSSLTIGILERQPPKTTRVESTFLSPRKRPRYNTARNGRSPTGT